MTTPTNMVLLIGYITKAPEVKDSGKNNGNIFCSFNLAVQKFPKSPVEFHRCIAWNQTANIIGEHVKRGDTLSVTGSIESKLIEAGNDKKYTQVTVIVNSVKMLGNSFTAVEEEVEDSESCPI